MAAKREVVIIKEEAEVNGVKCKAQWIRSLFEEVKDSLYELHFLINPLLGRYHTLKLEVEPYILDGKQSSRYIAHISKKHIF